MPEWSGISVTRPLAGGDVGLGLAWLVLLAMAGMAFTLSAAATILATVTLRNDRRATAARVAPVLGALTLLAGTIGGVWLYLDVVRIQLRGPSAHLHPHNHLPHTFRVRYAWHASAGSA